jgi:hypothetical protein
MFYMRNFKKLLEVLGVIKWLSISHSMGLLGSFATAFTFLEDGSAQFIYTLS